MSRNVWVGIDAGKISHHCVVIDDAGEKLLSRKVGNDETDVLHLISEVTALADGGGILWATDLNAGGAALLIAVLVEHDQQLLYIPGRTVHHASAGYRGCPFSPQLGHSHRIWGKCVSFSLNLGHWA